MKNNTPVMKDLLRTLPLLALALIPFQPLMSQAFEEGDNVIGLGLGIGGHYGAYASYTSQTPALGLYYEHGFKQLGPGVLGLGGFLGYKSLSYRSRYAWWGPSFEYDWRWTYLIIGARGAYHYNDWHGLDALDTYGGLMLSYNSVKWVDNTRYPVGFDPAYRLKGSSLGLTGFLGARYYFTPNFGAQGEVGYGISILSLGLVYKL